MDKQTGTEENKIPSKENRRRKIIREQSSQMDDKSVAERDEQPNGCTSCPNRLRPCSDLVPVRHGHGARALKWTLFARTPQCPKL